MRNFIKGHNEVEEKFSAAFKAWFDARSSLKPIVSEIFIFFCYVNVNY